MPARDSPRPKIGAGSMSAWMRQGAREIRAALYPGSNVAQPAELGMWGTQTPGEIDRARRDEAARDETPQHQPSVLSAYEPQRQPAAEPRQPDRDAAERQAPQQPEPELEKED